jgi:hypothetical protein
MSGIDTIAPCSPVIDISIIHDTLAVIANEVKQSSGLLSWIATPASPPDGTTSQSTGKTTSHPTNQPQNGCQVVGYKPASWQAAGYRNDGHSGTCITVIKYGNLNNQSKINFNIIDQAGVAQLRRRQDHQPPLQSAYRKQIGLVAHRYIIHHPAPCGKSFDCLPLQAFNVALALQQS